MDYWLIINAIIVFTIAFALSSICVPLVIKLAIKKRLLGEYGEGRHVHKGYVPRLGGVAIYIGCLLYTSPSPRDRQKSRMPSSA